MVMAELASIFHRRSVDQFSTCREEAPLQEESDLPGTETGTLSVQLPYVHLGSWRRSLAASVVIGSAVLVALILVAFALVQGSPQRFNHKGIKNKVSSELNSRWVQWMQQIDSMPSCNYDAEDICPALALFYNPEVLDVATENLMKVGRGFLKPADRDIVKAAVANGFKNITFELQMRSPKVAKELRMVGLSKMQKNAVLFSMQLLSNPRVQSIGRDIGQVIHDSRSIDKEAIKRNIVAKLQSRTPEIMKLRSETVPELLGQLWDGGHQWAMTLDDENIRIMGPYKSRGKFGAIKKSTNNAEPQNELTPFLVTTYSILGGVLEEGRALLDIIELCGHVFGKHLEVPYWVTYVGGNMEVTSEFLSCEHHFVNSDREQTKIEFTSALFCPLKFGSQGMDALKAVFDMDGKRPSIPDSQFAASSLVEGPIATSVAPKFRLPVPKPRLRIIGA